MNNKLLAVGALGVVLGAIISVSSALYAQSVVFSGYNPNIPAEYFPGRPSYERQYPYSRRNVRVPSIRDFGIQGVPAVRDYLRGAAPSLVPGSVFMAAPEVNNVLDVSRCEGLDRLDLIDCLTEYRNAKWRYQRQKTYSR